MKPVEAESVSSPLYTRTLRLPGVLVSGLALACFGLTACSSPEDAPASYIPTGESSFEETSDSGPLGPTDPEYMWLPAAAGGGEGASGDEDTTTITACSLVRNADQSLIYRVIAVEDLREGAASCGELPFGGGTYIRFTVEPLVALHPPDFALPDTMEVLSTSRRGQFEGTMHFAKLRFVEGHWVLQPGGLHVEQRASDADFSADDAERLAADRGVDWRLPFTLEGIIDAIAQAVADGECIPRHTQPRTAEELAESYHGFGERYCSDDPADGPVEGTDGGDSTPEDAGDSQ